MKEREDVSGSRFGAKKNFMSKHKRRISDVRVDLKRFHEIAKVGFDSESIKTLRTHDDSFVVTSSRDEETAFTKCVP